MHLWVSARVLVTLSQSPLPIETIPNMSIAVAIIEDDPFIRKSLCDVINTSTLCAIVGTAGHRSEAMALIAENKADVYVVDLGLPDVDGIELLSLIKANCLNARSMVLSTLGDPKHVNLAIKAGASGYLLKDTKGADLVEKIVNLYNGASPVSPQVAAVLFKRIASEGDPRQILAERDESIARYQLAPREVEVLDCLTEGQPIQLIADQLGISTHTVNQHLRNIYRKLDVRSRAMAVSVALQNGLVQV